MSTKDPCTLCRWVREDLELHGRLTNGHPSQGECNTEPVYPVSGKIAHLILEKIFVDSAHPARIIGIE